MGNLDGSQWINYMMGLLLKKIVVPTDFSGQCKAVAQMLSDDVTGLVDSLTDFAVETASVDFEIESDNAEYSRIMNQWLKEINKGFKGRIPIGIDALAKEYYKERWKGSSFPVLKMGDVKPFAGGLLLPTKMYFVDGKDIIAKAKTDDDVRHLLNYDYYLGSTSDKKYKLDGDNVIFARPYGRWFDKYPTPYLVKRGVYHNWKIIESIKGKQSEILDQIIPYLLLVKKGSSELVRENIKTGYTDPELAEIKKRIQELADEMNDISSNSSSSDTTKSPIRVTNYDESIEHLIPNLENIFKPELTQVSERNILSALGFIDIVEATSTSRRESILNPKGFIEETKSGVKGFKGVLQQIMYYVKETNTGHTKYMNVDYRITNSPIIGFMTDEFKRQVKRLFDAGKVSAKTAVELIAEVEFETEVKRRKQEAEDGIEQVMYPQLTQNQEAKGIDFPIEEKQVKKTDKNNEEIPEDKVNENEKQEYNIGAKYKCECVKCGYKKASDSHCKDLKCPKCGGQMRRAGRPGPGKSEKAEDNLETAPYKTPKQLPKTVKKNLSPSLQKTFVKVFNDAYDRYDNDTKAFRVAWSVIKKIAKRKNGKWRRKEKAKLTKAMVISELEQIDKE